MKVWATASSPIYRVLKVGVTRNVEKYADYVKRVHSGYETKCLLLEVCILYFKFFPVW
jgi:hypothetical protein